MALTKANDQSWPPEALRHAQDMRRRGATFQAIADVLGLTKNAVAGKLKRLQARGIGVQTRERMAHRACRDPIGDDEPDDTAVRVAMHLADLRGTGRRSWSLEG